LLKRTLVRPVDSDFKSLAAGTDRRPTHQSGPGTPTLDSDLRESKDDCRPDAAKLRDDAKTVEAWQKSELTDITAKVVIYEAFVEGRLEATKHLALSVHDLYFEPKYEECRPRTIWSLSNAFTSAFKELEPTREKIMRLHSVCSTIENGFVHLPDRAEWLETYLHEITAFPKGSAVVTSRLTRSVARRSPSPSIVLDDCKMAGVISPEKTCTGRKCQND
jgi:hypothetical protein